MGLTGNLTILCKRLRIKTGSTLSCPACKAGTGVEDTLRMGVIVSSLNVIHTNPEELDLLGSVVHDSTNRREIGNGSCCFHFGG